MNLFTSSETEIAKKIQKYQENRKGLVALISTVWLIGGWGLSEFQELVLNFS